jgi:DNA-binding transcriptional LysR family regulator
MELRHLRYFCAAAEAMHIGRAAETLRIAQPALTIQIKALERELGVALFDRIGRTITLTEAGRHFLAEATAILQHVERASLATREIGGGFAGRLRVGFTESAAFSPIVTTVLTAFRSQWPAVTLVLEESHTEELVTGMLQGRIDVAFVRPPIRAEARLSATPLADETMMLAMPIGHRLAGVDAVLLGDLAEEDFIVYPRKHGTGLSDSVIAECRKAGFAPRIVQETPQLAATINLVAAGVGIAIVPACMREVRRGSVMFVPIRDLAVKARLAIVHRERDTTRTVQNFSAMARSFRI